MTGAGEKYAFTGRGRVAISMIVPALRPGSRIAAVSAPHRQRHPEDANLSSPHSSGSHLPPTAPRPLIRPGQPTYGAFGRERKSASLMSQCVMAMQWTIMKT
jgi:hypothetical protein